MALPRSCIECGAPSTGTRCRPHQAALKRIRNADAAACAAQVRAEPWCWRCGATDDLTAQHDVPVSRGGRAADGLTTLCRSCNSALGNA